MLTILPFLMSANSLGVISLVVISGSAIVFLMPAMATRGMAQLAWLGLGGALVTAEAVVLIVLIVMTSNRGGNVPFF